MINKFRGDVTLFDRGLEQITEFTDWPSFGVVPFLPDVARLPAEDSVALEQVVVQSQEGDVVAVPILSRISNFDDIDPLKLQPGVRVVFVKPGDVWPQEAKLVILPGSNSTIADLNQFKTLGWDGEILNHVKRGGHVIGICGGYQMLGNVVKDPDGIEGAERETKGLGLLDMETTLVPSKTVLNSDATDARSGEALSGYEIHMGRTTGQDCANPMVFINNKADGAVSTDGCVMGCYLHGMFATDAWRQNLLRQMGFEIASIDYKAEVEMALDALADHLEKVIDPKIFDLSHSL